MWRWHRSWAADVVDDSKPAYSDFRGLFGTIEEYHGATLYRDVLAPWLARNGTAARTWLAQVAQRRGNPIPAVSVDESVTLYALSRINDVLLSRCLPGPTSELSLDDYIVFVTGIGMQVAREASFSPFYHEIVNVEQDPVADAAIVVRHECWPALMLGSMMFSRAGAAVAGGRQHIRKDIAETSTLYWAFRRRNRPRQDLSVGWGSNSQWGTLFRRDYRIGEFFYFNVDGTNDLAHPFPEPDRDGLTPQARLELLLHRCFISATNPSHDCFPYDDTYRLAIPGAD
jgi:hypothetical protein